MKKGIYHYSPLKDFKMGNIGQAVVNLCNTSPSLYVDEVLYESNSKNGLNLHLIMQDKPFSFQGHQLNFLFKFSYDISLNDASVVGIEITQPDGSIKEYKIDSGKKYVSTEDQSYIEYVYNESNCEVSYRLIDQEKNQFTFVKYSNNVYYLKEIKLKNNKKIYISRDENCRLSSITSTLTNEKIQFTYLEKIATAKIYRIKEKNQLEQMYEYSISLNNQYNGLNIAHYICEKNGSKRGYKVHACTYANQKITFSETRQYLQFTYTFKKDETGQIIQYIDDNRYQVNIEYQPNYAIVRSIKEDSEMKYVWDEFGRVTHIYDLKEETFCNINYDGYHHVVIKSATLFNDKTMNLNYLGNTKELDVEGNVNDLISVIADIHSETKQEFNINIIFKRLDENKKVVEVDKVTPYLYKMSNNNGTNSFVFSTFSNIKFNHVSVEINGFESTIKGEIYLYRAGLTENYLYHDKTLIGTLKYGKLSGVTRTYEKILQSPTAKYKYDDQNRLIKSVDINGVTTDITYDDNWNEKEIKTTVNGYCTCKGEKYDNNNLLEVKSESTASKLSSHITYTHHGLIESVIIKDDENNEIEKTTNTYTNNTIPFVSEKTIHHQGTSETIKYGYENDDLNKITCNNKTSLHLDRSANPPHEINNLKINSKSFAYYLYKTLSKDGVTVYSDLLDYKTYANGSYYFNYDEKDRLITVLYSEQKTRDTATILHVFTYETINHKDVLKSMSTYNAIKNRQEVTVYQYDQYGNCIGKKSSNNSILYKGYCNEMNAIDQQGSSCLYTKKDVQRKQYKNPFYSYVRSLNENIKLCAFDQAIEIEDENQNKQETYSLLFNSICECDEKAPTSCLGVRVANNGIVSPFINWVKYDDLEKLNYIPIDNITSHVNYINTNLIYQFSEDNNMLHATHQTVAFVFRKDESYNRYSTNLLTLTNSKNEQNSISINVFEEEYHDVISAKLFNLTNQDNSFNIEFQLNPNHTWHFVAFTYNENKVSLFVDGQYQEQTFNTSLASMNFDQLFFLKQGFPFDLACVMVPYQKALSNDRILNLYDAFMKRNQTIINELLDESNDTSYTTFHTITENLFDGHMEYISFSKTLSSLHGLKPKIDYSCTSLQDDFMDKFFFDEETFNYAYKLCGKTIEYDLDPSKYEKSFSVSFMFKGQDNASTSHSIIKFISDELSFGIAFDKNQIAFETTSSEEQRFDISLNHWELITLEMIRVIDNCSNQVFEYCFDLYINGVWKWRNKVSLNTKFKGFNKFLLDFVDTHLCESTTTPCLIKDLIINDLIYTTESQQTGLLKLNQKSYINTQLDVMGLKKSEVIMDKGKTLLTYSYGYSSSTKLSQELFIINTDKQVLFQTYDYDYDDYNRIIKQSGIGESKSSNYTYDHKGQLTKAILKHNQFNNGAKQTYQYQYDDNGNLLSILLNDTTLHSFTYDSYGRLNQADNVTITYADETNRLSLNPAKVGNNTYNWQGNRLMAIHGDVDVQYAYNEQGLRIFKRIKKGVTSSNNPIYEDHEYVYDLQDKLIFEKVSTTYSATHHFVYLYHQEQLYGFEYDHNQYYYIRDALGNINGIINSSGELICEYIYDAYGNVLDIISQKDNNIGVVNSFCYKGYYFDAETGLFYCNSRYYSPELCRWISPDSIEYLDPKNINGLNLYCYCYNNPIMYFDYMGNLPVPVEAITSIIGYSADLYSFGLKMSLKSMPELSMSVAKNMARKAGHIQSARSYIRSRHSNIVKTQNLSKNAKNFSKHFGRAVLVADILWSVGENYASGDSNWVSDSVIDVGISVGIYALGCIPYVGWALAIGATILSEVFDDEIEEFKDWFANGWNEF